MGHINFFAQINNKRKVKDNQLVDPIHHFNKYRLTNEDFEFPDLLGAAYEYLIKDFADSAGGKRWGSSGPKGTVNFSWRLIMAPMGIIDYVIVHELVHLEQRDHSRLFWDKVKSILPDFKRRQKWLKDNERVLNI